VSRPWPCPDLNWHWLKTACEVVNSFFSVWAFIFECFNIFIGQIFVYMCYAYFMRFMVWFLAALCEINDKWLRWTRTQERQASLRKSPARAATRETNRKTDRRQALTNDVDELLQDQAELDDECFGVIVDRTLESIVSSSCAEQFIKQPLLVRSLDRLCTHVTNDSDFTVDRFQN